MPRESAPRQPRGGPTIVVPPLSYGYRHYSRYGYGYYPWGFGGLGFGDYYDGFYDPWYGGYSRYGIYPGYGGYSGYGQGGSYRSLYQGQLHLKMKPRDAQVFVDGYYAGVVDDFDGIFQRLELEAGPHRIDVRAPGYEPARFDVQIEPDRTTTYRGDLRPAP